jgi:hypothetical protein
MSAITKQADSGFGSIELSLPRRESALCNTKSLALCAGQREGNGTQPDSDPISFDVSDGSKAEKLRLSKCLLLFPQQRTFIKATAANSTRIDAARNKPPHPELIDKFADWLIALSSGGLFVLNSNFLRVNEAHRSAPSSRQRIDHPPPRRSDGAPGSG